MNVLIITGGNSSEREVSLNSAAHVKQGSEANGHVVEIFDFNAGYDGLAERLNRADVCFPVMHGKEGEDGTLYGYLSSTRKPYIGSNPVGVGVAFDKILFKEYCDKNDIITAEWSVVKEKTDVSRFGFPCVLKAASGGSSHEVAPLFKASDLENQKVNAIFQLEDRLFVERYVQGIEITIGVLLNESLPVIEIVPPKNGWFDYENKYSGESREIPFAPSLSETIQKEAQQIALRVHQDLKLGSFSRTDMIIMNGTPYILEVNTPGGVGLTPKSLFPKAVEAAGISFERFVDIIIRDAQSRVI